MVLPNFICIGAPKCGTTWLFHCLREHPDVFIPDEKELHFFNIVDRDVYTSHGVSWYAAFFKDASQFNGRGDICPCYMREAYVPERIKCTVPECKMIAVLRNPINRAYSDYWMWMGRSNVNYTFADLVTNVTHDPHQILSTGL